MEDNSQLSHINYFLPSKAPGRGIDKFSENVSYVYLTSYKVLSQIQQ